MVFMLANGSPRSHSRFFNTVGGGSIPITDDSKVVKLNVSFVITRR